MSWAQSSEGIDKQDEVVVGFFTLSWVQTSLGRGSLPSHFILLFVTLLTLTSRVVFTVIGVDMDVDVDAFMFQLAGMVMVTACS